MTLKVVKFKQSRNVSDYSLVLDGLYEEFGNAFCHTILSWCGVMGSSKEDNRYWQVWLLYHGDTPIGICGLYSLNDSTEELWLGWLGIIPEYRNKGVWGLMILNQLKFKARKVGCKRLFSYVEKGGRPLNFYYKHGFKKVGLVKDYLNLHLEVDVDEFEDTDDIIITLDL